MTQQASSGVERVAAAAPVSANWERDRFDGALYDFVIKRRAVAQAYGILLFASDFRLLYRDIEQAFAELPDGSDVLDIPCGGGIAFRGLRRDRPLHYVAADLSENQLSRGKTEAALRGLDWIEFTSADVTRLSYPEASFDMCVSYMSLHCFQEPGVAIREMGRVLRPGGMLRGSVVLRGRKRRAELSMAILRRLDIFSESGTEEDLRRWFAEAGLNEVRLLISGAVAYFQARRAVA